MFHFQLTNISFKDATLKIHTIFGISLVKHFPYSLSVLCFLANFVGKPQTQHTSSQLKYLYHIYTMPNLTDASSYFQYQYREISHSFSEKSCCRWVFFVFKYREILKESVSLLPSERPCHALYIYIYFQIFFPLHIHCPLKTGITVVISKL